MYKQKNAPENGTVFRLTFAATLAAIISVVAMTVSNLAVPTLVLQPSQLYGPVSEFIKATNENPGMVLKFFAADSAFVLSYLMVFIGAHAVIVNRAGTFAAVALGAGILTALLDAVENAFFITYALSALNGIPLTEPSLPLIYILGNLKWMAGFAAFYAFGLVWPRDSRLGLLLSFSLLLFPFVGVISIAWPSITPLRGIFFLIPLILFAVFFLREARSVEDGNDED